MNNEVKNYEQGFQEGYAQGYRDSYIGDQAKIKENYDICYHSGFEDGMKAKYPPMFYVVMIFIGCMIGFVIGALVFTV